MPCCRCNRSGRCRNCSCVKADSLCQSCLHQCLGNCSNNGSTTTPITTPPQIASQIPEHHITVSIAAPDEGSPMNTPDESEHDGTPPTMPVSPPITICSSPRLPSNQRIFAGVLTKVTNLIALSPMFMKKLSTGDGMSS